MSGLSGRLHAHLDRHEDEYGADPISRALRAVLNRCDWWDGSSWLTADRVREAIAVKLNVPTDTDLRQAEIAKELGLPDV